MIAKGAKAVAGFPLKKPKPFLSSVGMRFRKVMSLQRVISFTWGAASASFTPSGVSPRITQTSASKSRPHSGLGRGMSSVGPSRTPEPPW